jgi:seryl-tRNA synthetase
MKEIAGRLKQLRAQAAEQEAAVDELYMRIPNIPHESVPAGGEENNEIVRTWGEPLQPEFPIKTHWDIGADLGILNLESASRMSGSGFTLLTDDGARLERALINFMIDVHREQGYREANIPYLVNRSAMTGTGQLPKLEFDMYRCEQDDLFLIPTAEVSVTNIHREETLREEDLPIYYVAFSPCFRREAGAAGKDTRGLLRLHQFHKVEMVKFTSPDTSWDELESLTRDAEEILRRLQLPYRVVNLASADLSFAAAKCYDLEVWSAGVENWLEVSSCSNFTDFQARRAAIRFKGRSDRGFVHTLNGSGLALPRILVAIMENYQTATGRIRIPEALHPYLDGQQYIG